MITETISHDGMVILVGEATTRLMMRREITIGDLLRAAGDEANVEERMLIYTYGDIVGATISIQGRAMPSFDEFCNMPASVTRQWVQVATRLNPAFYGQSDEEKKDEPTMPSNEASSAGE